MIKRIFFIFICLLVFINNSYSRMPSEYNETTGFIQAPFNVAETENMEKIFISINAVNKYLNDRNVENYNSAKQQVTNVLIDFFSQTDENVVEVYVLHYRSANLLYLFFLEYSYRGNTINQAIENVINELNANVNLNTKTDWNNEYLKTMSRFIFKGYIIPRFMANFPTAFVPDVKTVYPIGDAFFLYMNPGFSSNFVQIIRNCDLYLRNIETFQKTKVNVLAVWPNLTRKEKIESIESIILVLTKNHKGLDDDGIANKIELQLRQLLSQDEYETVVEKILSTSLYYMEAKNRSVGPSWHEAENVDDFFNKTKAYNIRKHFIKQSGDNREQLAQLLDTFISTKDTLNPTLITNLATFMNNRLAKMTTIQQRINNSTDSDEIDKLRMAQKEYSKERAYVFYMLLRKIYTDNHNVDFKTNLQQLGISIPVAERGIFFPMFKDIESHYNSVIPKEKLDTVYEHFGVTP